MIIIDWVILAIVGISALISLVRGFVKEALSLASWVIAFFVARIFSGNLATLLENSISTNSVRWLVSFALLFVATLVVCAMVNYLIAQVVKITGLGGLDRVFGMVFGLMRGLMIVVALVYGAQLTMIPQDQWWQDSQIIPYLESIADWARKTLPGAVNQVLAA